MGAFWNVPTVDPLLWVSRKEIASVTRIPTYLVEVRRKKYRVEALLIILFSGMLKIFKNNLFQIKKYCVKYNSEYLGIFHLLKLIFHN